MYPMYAIRKKSIHGLLVQLDICIHAHIFAGNAFSLTVSSSESLMHATQMDTVDDLKRFSLPYFAKLVG